MKKYNLIILILTLLYSCINKTSCNCKNSFENYNDSIINSLSKSNKQILKERKLLNIRKYKNETYRISTHYSFNRYCQSYTFRKTKDGGKIEVLQFVYIGNNNYLDRDLKIDKKETIYLNKNQWKSIEYEINRNCFWTNKIGLGYRKVLDGDMTILEGFDPNKSKCSTKKYHIDIVLNGTESKIWDLCLKLRKYVNEDSLKIHL